MKRNSVVQKNCFFYVMIGHWLYHNMKKFILTFIPLNSAKFILWTNT